MTQHLGYVLLAIGSAAAQCDYIHGLSNMPKATPRSGSKRIGSMEKPPLTPAQKPQPRFMDLLQAYWRMYCEKSTIHGVRYIYDLHLHGIERLIWGALVVACIVLTCIFYVVLSDRYDAKGVETYVEDPQYPVFYVPFPAVAICPDNRINWLKLDAAKAKFLPANDTKELSDAFTALVMHMETLRFGNFIYSATDVENQNLESLHFINISALAMFMALQCEDIFEKDSCSWRGIPFDCCDYFIEEKTEYGECPVFNSMLSPASKIVGRAEGEMYYPKHNSKAGQGTGLNFQLLINDSFYRVNSTASYNVFVIIKPPDQLMGDIFSMSANTETYFTVHPEITNTHESMRGLPPDRRNCLFPEEFKYENEQRQYSPSFMLSNCWSTCHENNVIKLCNCTLPLFFVNMNRNIFSYDKPHGEDAYFSGAKPGMDCYCLVNCNFAEYFTDTTTLPLDTDLLTNLNNSKFFKVDVHYQTELIIKYRTSLEFTSIDLIANFGGIFGLCLGASMVSAVELFYYLTFGFALYLYDHGYYAVFRANFKVKWQSWQNAPDKAAEGRMDVQPIKRRPPINRLPRHNAW